MKLTKFRDIPQFTSNGHYSVNVDWDYLEKWLDGVGQEIDLDPDFQRTHVWDLQKQIDYVEYVLKGGTSSKQIFFNMPGWMSDWSGKLELVDGKQRLEAVRSVLNNKFPVFGSYYNEFEDRLRSLGGVGFIITVNDLKTRREVLEWYLALNSGGVVHTSEELEKVKELLELEK